MAISNYSTDLLNVTVNGREINDWGSAEPPFTIDPIDPKGTLNRGQGGNAARNDRINPGVTATFNLQPGGADSAYMSSLMNSRANIEVAYIQIGTGEAGAGAEGMFVNVGQIGRGGQNPTDDVFIIELNKWDGTTGGEG